MEMKNFNYILEISILRNSSQKKLGVPRGAFEGFGCPKRHQGTLLAKTMTSSLSLVIQLPAKPLFRQAKMHMKISNMLTA